MACALPMAASGQTIYWLNHLDFLPGDPSVTTSFRAVSCPGVGGLSGLAINSSTTGEIGIPAGNKVVQKGVPLPPDFLVRGVRVCYEVQETSSNETFISQIRIAQLGDPPFFALVRLDDGTDLTDDGPVCVNSEAPVGGPVEANPAGLEGAIRLSLRVNFGDTDDTICLRGVGLLLCKNPACKS